jgi:integrase
METDHIRNHVWKPALTKAQLDYKPMIQTRHTFATIAIDTGENVGWVKEMMGHSSLQMIYTRYYGWMKKRTRNDGSAFTASFGTGESNREDVAKTKAKIIKLVPKTYQTKKGLTA